MQKNRMALIRKTVASLLIAAMVCPYAYAADVGKATYVQGRVDVLRSGSDSYAQLKDGDPISVGDSVRTKANSKAEVTFADNSTIRLAQNSKVAVKDYVVDSANKRKTAEIALERGRVRTIIAKMPDKSEFNISTPNARGTVKGSDVFA